MLKFYLGGGSSPIQRRDDRVVIRRAEYEPTYITPVREGNKAFPVFLGLKNLEKKDDLLDKNINNDCEKIQNEEKKPETLLEALQMAEEEINEILKDYDESYQKVKKLK